MSTPSSSTSPPSAGRNPVSTSNSVVFPAPLWPMSPTIVAGWMVRWTSSSARMPPNRLVTPRASSVTPRDARSHGGGTDRRDGRSAAHVSGVAADEHRPQDVGPVEQPGGRAAEPDLALLQEHRPLAQQQGDVHRLLDHHHGRAGRVDLAHLLDQPVDHGRRQAERELVDAAAAWAWSRTPSPARAAAARRPTGRRRAGRAAGRGSGTSSTTSCRARGGRRRVVAEHPARQPQVLGHGQGREHALAAGHERQAQPGDVLGRQAGDVAAVEHDRARRSAAAARPSTSAPSTCRRRWCRAGRASRCARRPGRPRTAPAASRRTPRRPSLVSRSVPSRRSRRTLPTWRPGAGRVAVDGRPAAGLDVCSTVSTWSTGSMPWRRATTRHEPVAPALERLGQAAGDDQQDGSRPTPVSSSWARGNR